MHGKVIYVAPQIQSSVFLACSAVRERAQIMKTRKSRRQTTLSFWAALIAVPVACGIEVESTVSCSLANREYLDISSLECVQCDDDRYVRLPCVELCVQKILYP